ncbi:MAG TPA: FHA domain-containing protein, partial [Anaerolineae bacterium]|nr:FHA domain-containing protein [Anaerolineae bacterium]
LDEDESFETSPGSRRHVTYVIREEGKADVIGSLGDDGGVISRINLKDSQILLPPKDVSTPHALLRLRPDGRVTIKDLRSRNGTFVGDSRLADGKQRRLQDGDHIRFGESVEFELDLQRRKLVSLNNNSITRDLNSADQWLITRRNLHSVVIPNTHLSSPHMLIRPSDDVASEIRIKDLHSHNPTIVDGNLKLSELSDGTFVDEETVTFKVGKTTYSITARSLKSVDVIGGRYKVIKQVYISKMADVYAVKDNQMADSPLFAAKILNTHQEKGVAARDAFQKEITLMQALDNPHLVPCVATGHDDSYDAPYYVMPFLEGSDMRRVLHWRRRQAATGALRLADIREIFHATCSALESIHKLNIAHCDLKPANIFITHQREIRLLDLGVVTPFGEHAEFFTQFYSAPEVGSKQLPPVSRASDVYSLGVLLLEMLTGIEAKEMSGYATEPAQDVSNTESSKPQHSLENLKQWLDGVPSGDDFLPVIAKASQHNSAERYQSIPEFLAAFEQAFEGAAAQQQLSDEGHKANLAALSRQTDGI